jgi:hypothetical protein
VLLYVLDGGHIGGAINTQVDVAASYLPPGHGIVLFVVAHLFNVVFHVNPVVHLGLEVNSHSNPDGVFSGTILLRQLGIL